MSQIVENSWQIGQKLLRVTLGRGSSSWREQEEWGVGARAGTGEGKIRYKCAHICNGRMLQPIQMCWPHICAGRSHHPVQMCDICTMWVGDGPDAPLWESICTSTNVLICTRGKNTLYKSKTSHGQMPDSMRSFTVHNITQWWYSGIIVFFSFLIWVKW
jgi:hypothetical protein